MYVVKVERQKMGPAIHIGWVDSPYTGWGCGGVYGACTGIGMGVLKSSFNK